MTETGCHGHVLYLSEMLAVNAAALHRLTNPACPAIGPFAHDGHWHIGHPDRRYKQACAETWPGPPYYPRAARR